MGRGPRIIIPLGGESHSSEVWIGLTPSPKALRDLSADDICMACEQNYIDYWRSVGLTPNAEFSEDGGITRCITGLGQEFLNVVMSCKLPGDSLGSSIDAMIDQFRRRRLLLTWHVGRLTVPRDLGRHLEARGFPHDYDLTAMAYDLEQEDVSKPPEGVAVRRVSSGEDCRTWVSCLTRGWESPPDVAPWMNENACYNIPLESRMRISLPRRMYLGMLNGRPVGASMLFWSKDVAGLQCVGTAHEGRGKGVGGAVVSAALADARALGFRHVVVLSTVEGIGMYRRVGFLTFGKLPEHSMDFRLA